MILLDLIVILLPPLCSALYRSRASSKTSAPTSPLEPVPVSRTPDGGVHPAPAQAGLPAARRCGQSVPQVGLLRQTRFLSPPSLLFPRIPHFWSPTTSTRWRSRWVRWTRGSWSSHWRSYRGSPRRHLPLSLRSRPCHSESPVPRRTCLSAR